MRPKAPLLAAAVLAVAALAAVAPAAIVESPQFDPQTMMRVSELHRGMTGYGLSVFSGVEITRFDVEVLGVLSRANLGEDLILIRVTSGPVVERQSGIVGGMSGSPVFVNGRLIGAIAYGWSFLREPIAGVTPIESMLDSWMGEQQQATLPHHHPLRGVALAGRWVEQGRIDAEGPAFADEHTINLRPVRAPISVAGMGEGAMARLAAIFQPYGIEAVPGPGRLAEPVPVELQPGCAIGLTLMDGDFDASVVATLTWRNGDRILAFGHPFMQIGDARIPLVTGWVHDFLPSVSRSSKLSSPMEIVGSLAHDGTWSIAGEVGADAPMVPGHFAITDADRGITREFDVRIAQQELITPGLMMSALLAATEATFSPGSDGIATLEFELRGENGAVIRRRDVIAHPGAPALALGWVDEAMYLLTENRFSPEPVASLNASVTLTDTEQPAVIERVYTDEHVARAGEQLTVHVVLRPEKGERFEQVVRFDLPEDLPKGTVRVGAASGEEEYSLRSLLRLLMPQINSLEGIARLVESMKRADQLYVALSIPRPTIGLEGTELLRLPVSAVRALSADEASDVQAAYTELSETLDSEHYLYGLQIAQLPSENRLGERGKVRETNGESERSGAMTAPGGLQHLWWAASALDSGARPLQATDLPGEDEEAEGTEDLASDVAGEEAAAEAAEEAAAEGEEAAQDTGEHPEPDGEALARGLSRFSHTSAEDFAKGRTEGTMVRSDGTIVLAPRAEMIATAEEPVIWSLAADAEGVWFGTGNPGRVYRWRAGEEAKAICDTGSLLVLSLLPADDGSVLAGTGPDGRILRISADGAMEVVHELPATYVWALARRADGTVLAGTGPEGRIYRLGAEAELLTTITQPHALALAVSGDRVYVAAGDNQATVFEIGPEGGVREVFGSGDDSCTGIAAYQDGRLVVTTAASGKVYLIEPGKGSREVYSSDAEVMHGVAVVDGQAWAGTADDGKLVVIDEEKRTGVGLHDLVSEQIVRLAAGDGVVYAAAAGPARVWRLDLHAVTEGSYRSPGLDAARLSRWARMAWDATQPEGASIAVDARSGNNRLPEDGSWSAWIGPLAESGATLDAPPARYVQYRLRLAGSYTDSPQVRRAELLYLPANRKPKLKVTKPEAGDAIRGKFKITWDADDEDKDTMLATIWRRPTGGQEWERVAVVQGEESYEWDTTQVAGGRYDLRVVLSDEPSNPTGAEEDEVLIEDLIVDNGYPKLALLSTPRRNAEPREVYGLATDELSRITSIDWTFGSEERWRAAAASDSMLDSRRELFTISLPEIPDAETEIQVRVRDAAGNVTVETVPLLDQRPPDAHPPPPVEGAQEQG
ncbi:MAG: SpoIVB peptidase S55 domain-containing protein [Armatimonadota bacterium]